MQKSFENDFTSTTGSPDSHDWREETQDQVNASTKHKLISDLNRLTDYRDGGNTLHPQHYALVDAEKWLNAHIAYQQLDDSDIEGRHQATDKALRDGVFFDMATQTIDDRMRNLNSFIFASDVQPGDESKLPTVHQNRIYFEAWASLKDQSLSFADKPSDLPIHDIILAKKLFRDAHAAEDIADKQHTLGQSLAVAHHSHDTLVKQGLESSFAAITTNTLIAYTIHDLAVLGEFENNQTARLLSIDYLWQNAEDLASLKDRGAITERVLQKYINEVEYLRGKYSEEINLRADIRPGLQEDELPPYIQRSIGQTALLPILQRVA